MIQPRLAGTLRREFGGSSQAAVFQHFQKQQRAERQRRERDGREDEKGPDLLDMAALIISEAEIVAFRLEIDRYDTATIEALYANETALALIMQQKDDLLMRAYVLPDGRRVFKSEDGVRVFDEHGDQLAEDDIDPDLIGRAHPTWERYHPILHEEDRLIREREALLAYQGKLDEARDRLDAGDMTREEFDTMRDDLAATMPKAVRSYIPELASAQNVDSAMATRQPEMSDLIDEMRPTPTMPAPGLSN